MDKIVDYEINFPHEVSELICLKCLHRWIGVYPVNTLLKDLECKCGEVGYVIKTGQTIEEEPESEEECINCQLYVNGECKLKLMPDESYYCGYCLKKEDKNEN